MITRLQHINNIAKLMSMAIRQLNKHAQSQQSIDNDLEQISYLAQLLNYSC